MKRFYLFFAFFFGEGGSGGGGPRILARAEGLEEEDHCRD